MVLFLIFIRSLLRTDTKENIGANATWLLKENNTCEVSSNDKDAAKCRVEVWDENSLRANTIIGAAEISIKSLFENIGIPQKFSFTAFSPNGRHSAEVILTMKIGN